MNPKKKFLGTQAPEWYVAGLCRGATGFVTRSDIGPARQAPEAFFGTAPAGYLPGAGRGATGIMHNNAAAGLPQQNEERADYSETQYDKWSGYQGTLFSKSVEEDDILADKEYDKVDKYMDERRNKAREKRIEEEMEKAKKAKPPISHIFASCKKDLATVSRSEWESLPEAQNYIVKRKKYSRVMPVPDKILEDALKDVQYNTRAEDAISGITSKIAPTPLTEISIAKGQILNMRLRQMEDSVTGQSVVNTNSYMKELEIGRPETANFDISDLKKARLLMKSAITTLPHDPSGWIAAARIEEMDGRLQEARNIISQGCENCPESDDIWLEAARLSPPDKSKAILAKAISQQPKSVKLWLAAANKETDKAIKSKILRKGLEFIPGSPTLWKEAVKLEGPEEARQLLRKAVECVPFSVDMWLALAKLEKYEDAKVTLNRARMAVPTDHTIWIHAAMLEEAQGQPEKEIDVKIKRCVKTLEKAQSKLSRENWLNEAVNCEQAGSILTCRAIVKHTMELDLDPQDYKKTWLQNAGEAAEKGAIETSRALYYEACNRLLNKKSVWLKTYEFEKQNGTPEKILSIMEKGLKNNEDKPLFWLIYAKQLWLQGEIAKCREILGQAKNKHQNHEDIWLALIKFERYNQQKENVINLVREARKTIDSIKIWKQGIITERALGNIKESREIFEDATKKFLNNIGLWLLGIRIESEENNDIEKARIILQNAKNNCGEHPRLVIMSAILDMKENLFTRARTTLQEARQKYPDNENIWLESIRLEKKSDNEKIASFLMSKALQACPKSGKLWAEAIFMEPIHARKNKSTEALKVCDRDEIVVTSIACLFWADLKVEKARKWFSRAVEYNPINGDPWAYYYKFEKSMESAEIRQVVKKFEAAQPRKGELWKKVAKKPENWFLTGEEILKKVAESINFP